LLLVFDKELQLFELVVALLDESLAWIFKKS